ncbi:alkyl sulfatase dimerization domain-containing protein [Streptomyces sp. LHD-70]|uniref:alkyl sulfatase dimerization domain-containing protein n=1 Tax=Streptomyces sp. LHD-70 TaxID=3072140 RepID=UPI00280E78B8|nr:alkyl sulfatase dimerization domain-containing protein [Streptomyces sp. LHD-70]MDQ8703586.1 alkyl sulfatase dimerization domain-containing protein [Streptomyces sp. LHD-70]
MLATNVESSPLLGSRALESVAPGVHTVGLQGNSLAVETDEGLLIVDSGPSPHLVRPVLDQLREQTGKSVRWIVYSHGHLGYNYGVPGFLDAAAERGEPRPTVIAHANVVHRYRRYLETAGLQNHINARQFRRPRADFPRTPPLTFPDQTYTESLTLGSTGRTVRLLWAPSETDDVTAVWLPRERILYASAAVISGIPNIGTPMRTLRDPVRWADTLDRLAALRPALVIPEFGPVIREGAAGQLTATAAALRWLRQAVVERLNQGRGVDDIVHDLDYPAELFDVPWMRENYGHREYIVRDIARSETGWWDGNPTHLHPARPADAAAIRAEAITDRQAVLDTATRLRDTGRIQDALHVIDLLALAPGDDPHVVRARQLKGDLCALRKEEISSYVSRSCYEVATDAG